MLEQPKKDEFIKNVRETFSKVSENKGMTDLFVDFFSDTYDIFFKEKEPAEPKVLTVEAYLEKHNFYPDQFGFDIILDHFDAISRNGRLAEYQRPEQVELREALRRQSAFCVISTEVIKAFKALKPPTEHTEKEPEVMVFKTDEGARKFIKDRVEPAPESEKVLTVDEIMMKASRETPAGAPWTGEHVKTAIKISKDNFRLERDLEVKEIIETIRIIRDQFGGQDIGGHMAYLFQLYNNLKPLKAE